MTVDRLRTAARVAAGASRLRASVLRGFATFFRRSPLSAFWGVHRGR